ncbi:MAG TPA: deoxyhypusine synthase family protein [Candidatus Thermoplasmatota archaeon]|nr:deoxyhypusine synthase family protein [Candidatus Thermoplasmatota archaeon]
MPKITRKDLLQTPISQVEITKTQSVADLIDAMKNMSFQARNLGTCATVWENMLTDKERPTIILGLAGCAQAAGMRHLLRDLIVNGLVDVIVTTGSQPYQDLYAARGHNFWRSSPEADDLLLREHFLDRLYDTLVDEEAFRDTDEYLAAVLAELPPRAYTTREIYEHLGKHFDDPNSWVVAAAKHGVPIFCPALNDSSLGIGMVGEYVKAKEEGREYLWIDPIRDAYELAQIKAKSKSTGVIYIAGGVSKNYIQQTEVISEILGYNPGGHQYAIQITVDQPQWGGLSGCTFKEAQSWGKIAVNAKHSQAYVDMSIGLPLVAAALIQKKAAWKSRKTLKMVWKGDELVSFDGGKTKALGKKEAVTLPSGKKKAEGQGSGKPKGPAKAKKTMAAAARKASAAPGEKPAVKKSK